MKEQSPSIIEQLVVKLNDIKDIIKGGNVDSIVFDKLTKNAKLIQDKLNELLKKNGVYTQSDINDAYLTLQLAERTELEKQSKKTIKRLIIYGSIGVVLIVLLSIILKDKSDVGK